MADIRVVIGGVGGKFPSREPGTRAAFQMNTFGMQRLHDGVTGEMLAEICEQALEPAFVQVQEDWPKDTYASVETLEITVMEEGPKMARVALQIGGQKLIQDPRNVKHIDYAPYVEFNGTRTARPGTMAHAMALHEPEMKRMIHASVKQLIQDLLV